MQRKYTLILSLLVALPLLAFFALGRRLVQDDRARTQRQFQDLLRANLSEVDRSISAYFSQLEQKLLKFEVDASQPGQIREVLRREPLFEQIFFLAKDGTLIYPDPDGQLSSQETDYLLKIEQLISDRNLIRLWQQQPSNMAQKTAQRLPNFGFLTAKRHDPAANKKVPASGTGSSWETSSEPPPAPDHGWYTWYWGNGIQLIHWRGLRDGGVMAIGLQRARWMADVIAMLPDSTLDVKSVADPAQIRLVNAEGRPIYLWGVSQLAEGTQPVASLHLSPPLKPWQLEHFGPSQPLSIGRSGTLINLMAAGGLLFAGLMALAFYLSREIGRQTREARQRVNFVNQVSHELKTPLTNIRMYADLLDQDLQRIEAEEDQRATAHLAVITSESSRLSRLINNVLTFARLNRNTNPARSQSSSVDRIIREVVEQFRPSLEQLDIEVTLNLGADQQVTVDVDSLEQILGNLISNVEKYAAGGKHLRISSRHQQGGTQIDIADAGPGIPPTFAKRVFEPFERASDHIEAATGTGIGLAIAKGLARRCGGYLVLNESAVGASFRLTIDTPLSSIDQDA